MPGVDPPEVLAAAFGPAETIRVSENNGATWVETTAAGLPGLLSQLVVSSGVGYAVVGGVPLPSPAPQTHGLYRLQLNAIPANASWSATASPGVENFTIGASGSTIVALGTPVIGSSLLPNTPLWVPTYGPAELQVSTDGGKTWAPRSLPTVEPCGGAPAVAGSTIWLVCSPPAGSSVSGSYGVGVSTDLGHTWQVFLIPGKGVVAVVATGPSQAWLLTSDGTLLHTTDGGRDWQSKVPLLPAT